MKDQVTSIEQSKRLIELGVPAEKASMCWVKDPNENEYNLVVHNESCYEMAGLEPIPAFTVADRLEMLPQAIWEDCKGWCYLTIRFTSKKYSEIEYRGTFGTLWSCFGPSLSKNTIEAIEYVVTNGYGLNL